METHYPFHHYMVMNFHADDSNMQVIRVLRARIKRMYPTHLTRAHRDSRHRLYRDFLHHHAHAQRVYRAVQTGNFGLAGSMLYGG